MENGQIGIPREKNWDTNYDAQREGEGNSGWVGTVTEEDIGKGRKVRGEKSP